MGIFKTMNEKSRQMAGNLGVGGLTVMVRQNEAIIELLKEIKELLKEQKERNQNGKNI